MVEILKTPAVMADDELSQLLDSYDKLIGDLSPRNATAVWEFAAPDNAAELNLRISDTYSRSSRTLTESDLTDVDGMLERISQLVGDLIYQDCEGLLEPAMLAQLASFLPGRLCSRFAEPNPEIQLPSADHTSCALLFADISGFTNLTERLAKKGAVGAEELTGILNRYFGQLIEIIDEFGGDVLKFAGDALLATFEDRYAGSDQRDASARAVAASTAIQKEMQDFPNVDGTKLSLKIALAAGEIRMLHLGGVFGRCELLLVGDPLQELSQANDLAKPGDIVAAASLRNRVAKLVNSTPLSNDHHRIRSLRTNADDFRERDSSGQTLLSDAPFRADAIAAMRGYIPAAIYSRLAAGHTEWLGELREITVIFANLPGFNIKTSLSEAQSVMATLQQSIYHFEGSLNKLSVDDKGASMLAGFGLPPVAHEDDPARAIGAALVLQQRMQKLGWECSIGVASGRVFCGAYGNEDRREYTMIGDTVNTSARLMQAAQGTILCDQSTYDRAVRKFEFESLEPLRMKGKQRLVPCFSPVKPRGFVARNAPKFERQQTAVDRNDFQALTATGLSAMTGRDNERCVFEDLVQRLKIQRQGSALVLEGEAGMGRSDLALALAELAEQSGCRVLNGRGDAIERSTPWFAWRSVIAERFNDLELENENLEVALCEQLNLDQEQRKLLPLLSSVLPFAWPDNEWTSVMHGAVRANNTNRLLMNLIQHAAESTSLVLLLEDLHYFDSASVNLLRMMISSGVPSLAIATSRPPQQPLSKDYLAILQSPAVHHFRLKPISDDDSVKMATQLLGATRLPRSIQQLIRDNSHGHPLYVEELAYALRETATVSVTDGVAKLTGDIEQFKSRDGSNSLEGVIVNRVDRLEPSQQLTLKVASVIGTDFTYALLHDIFPFERERQHLRLHLESLNESNLTRCSHDRPDAEYSFRNSTVREVAYNLVLVKHRTALHHMIAVWIENRFADDLNGHYPRLAEHWEQAGNLVRAIECLEKAGENALLNNANQEAVRFYRKTLELAQQVDVREFAPLRRAIWHRRYGEALYRVGEIPASMQQLRTALEMLGNPDSDSIASQLWHGCFEMCRQLVTRIRGRFFELPAAKPNEALLESVRAYERLVEIQYQRTDMPAFLLATFRSLNLAEQYGVSTELARSYANVSAMTSAMLLPKAASRYTRRAEDVALKSQDHATHAYVRTINSVHFIGHGQWSAAGDTLEQALTLCESIGDHRRWSEAAALSMNLAAWTGEYDALAVHARKLVAAADAGLGSQVAMWAYGWLLWRESAEDAFSQEVETAEDELADWLESGDELALADEVLGRGGLLFARLGRNEWNQALAIADDIEAVLGNAQPVAVYLLPVYAALVELYAKLGGSESSLTTNINHDKMFERLRLMQKRLWIFSYLIPISGPLKRLCDGHCHRIKGRPKRAIRAFKKGLHLSEKLGMPYFSATLKREIAAIEE